MSSPLLAGLLARVDQGRRFPIGFANPALYSLYGEPGALYDVQATHQDQSRADFANSIDNSEGLLYSTRIIDYQGQEEYCDANNVCTTRNVALSTTPGYDSMTGLSSPGADFLQALSWR